MVSFKIGFEMTGEALFGLIAKFLPVDNLSVEEVPRKAEPRDPPVARLAHLKAVKPAKPERAKRKSKGLNLSDGVNGVIMGILEDGQPHRAVELEGPVRAKNYSGNSVGSRLQNLREHGIVEQIGGGRWRLTEAHRPKQSA
jgi:hypothetical protein